MKSNRLAVALTALCAVGVLGTTSVDAKVKSVKAKVDKRSEQLQKAVKVKNMREHQEELQEIADANGCTRASGTPGFLASVNYVTKELRESGYKVTRLAFNFDFYQKLGPSSLEQTQPTIKDFIEDTDFQTLEYSGSGTVSALVQGVDGGLVLPPIGGSTNGCNAGDFVGFTPGNIALIQRGTCNFVDKVKNAVSAGASAVIIFNEGNTPARSGLLGNVTIGEPVPVPVIGIIHAQGVSWRTEQPRVTLTTNTASEERETYNLVAETSGREDKVVVVGAHLDSRIEGPGIQDNGSGSAAILEIAQQMSKGKFRTKNKVRFMWFGAEEAGLLGSEDYVESLSETDLAKIALNLNFDMIASPNFARFVYDGDGSKSPRPGPTGSAEIELVFSDHFTANGLAFEPTPFDGRSDYGPFIAAGIPAGGLFTGAEGFKSAAQQVLYGGTAGVAFDSCYHMACDNYDNNNEQVFEEMADAAAHAVWYFANKSYPQAKPLKRNAQAKSLTNRLWRWDYKGGHMIR